MTTTTQAAVTIHAGGGGEPRIDYLGPVTVPLVKEWAARYGATLKVLRFRDPDHYDVHPEDIQWDWEVPDELDSARRRRQRPEQLYVLENADPAKARQANDEGSRICHLYMDAQAGFLTGYRNGRARLLATGYSAAALDHAPEPGPELQAAWEKRLEASRNAPDFG